MTIGQIKQLTKEDQWDNWLQDIEDTIIWNDLEDYFKDIVPMLADNAPEKTKKEFRKKHELVKIIIHAALGDNIRERMKQDGYDRSTHKGKEAIKFAEKAVKLISSNMDHLYNTQWKDIQQSDFKTWTQFMNKLRKLFHKLKETGQEVTQKSACIHLFEKV